MSSIRIWTIHGAYSAPVSHPHKPRKWLKKKEEEEKKLIRRSPGFRIYKRWSISSEETPESMKITWFDLQVILLIERAGKEHLRPLFFILFYYHSFFYWKFARTGRRLQIQLMDLYRVRSTTAHYVDELTGKKDAATGPWNQSNWHRAHISPWASIEQHLGQKYYRAVAVSVTP